LKEINLAAVLISKRREKGITQDELATHIGVSKQSVSKWENGNSYPDILLLPQLASYFNISLDELMGYEPQMMPADIRKLCLELSGEFAVNPFDDVMSRCRDIVKKYFSCFPLLFQIGVLILDNGEELNDESKKASAIEEAKGIFVRVKDQCDVMDIKQMALHCEALCEMILGNPNEVIALLDNEKNCFSLHPSVEVMLAESYHMLGKIHDAKITLQGAIFKSISAFFLNVPYYLTINIDDKKYFEEICKRTTQMIDVFNAKEVYPIAIMSFYLEAAKGYLPIGNMKKALAMLETYVEIAVGDIFSITPERDNFFALVGKHQNEAKSGIDFEFFDEFYDGQSTKQSIINAVVKEPAFDVLTGEPRYKALTKKLRTQREVL